MSDSDIEWLPGDPRRERAVLVCFWLGLALVFGTFTPLLLSLHGLFSIPPLLGVCLPFGALGGILIILAVQLLSRNRPGFYRVGLSLGGLAVRYPNGTRIFAWTELWWSKDRVHVEGKSWWNGPSPPLTLTPTQFERIQSRFYPR
jgi:hypothetical protein